MEVVAYQLLCKHENMLEVNRLAVPPELLPVLLDQPVSVVPFPFLGAPPFCF